MIKPVGVWNLSSKSDALAGGGGSTNCYFSTMRGIYQPLLWLLAIFGVK